MSDAGMATFKMGDDSCGINRLDLQKTSCQVFFNNVLHDITTLFKATWVNLYMLTSLDLI